MSTGGIRREVDEKDFFKKEVSIDIRVEEYEETMREFINEPVNGLTREELLKLVEDYQFLFEKLLE